MTRRCDCASTTRRPPASYGCGRADAGVTPTATGRRRCTARARARPRGPGRVLEEGGRARPRRGARRPARPAWPSRARRPACPARRGRTPQRQPHRRARRRRGRVHRRRRVRRRRRASRSAAARASPRGRRGGGLAVERVPCRARAPPTEGSMRRSPELRRLGDRRATDGLVRRRSSDAPGAGAGRPASGCSRFHAIGATCASAASPGSAWLLGAGPPSCRARRGVRRHSAAAPLGVSQPRAVGARLVARAIRVVADERRRAAPSELGAAKPAARLSRRWPPPRANRGQRLCHRRRRGRERAAASGAHAGSGAAASARPRRAAPRRSCTRTRAAWPEKAPRLSGMPRRRDGEERAARGRLHRETAGHAAQERGGARACARQSGPPRRASAAACTAEWKLRGGPGGATRCSNLSVTAAACRLARRRGRRPPPAPVPPRRRGAATAAAAALSPFCESSIGAGGRAARRRSPTPAQPRTPTPRRRLTLGPRS